MRALEKMNFQTPSPVQAASIKPMLARQDVLVQAPTGTGKTAAFGIPVIENIDSTNRHIQTVILCPTRELAVQTASVLKQLVAFKPNIRVLALYGGEPIYHQVTALKRRPQITDYCSNTGSSDGSHETAHHTARSCQLHRAR